MLRSLIHFIKFRFARRSENVGAVCAISQMVVDMIYNHGSFLFADNLNDLAYKFFWIIAEQSEL